MLSGLFISQKGKKRNVGGGIMETLVAVSQISD